MFPLRLFEADFSVLSHRQLWRVYSVCVWIVVIVNFSADKEEVISMGQLMPYKNNKKY